MRYNLNLSTDNNNKHNMLLFYEMKIITTISFPDPINIFSSQNNWLNLLIR